MGLAETIASMSRPATILAKEAVIASYEMQLEEMMEEAYEDYVEEQFEEMMDFVDMQEFDVLFDDFKFL